MRLIDAISISTNIPFIWKPKTFTYKNDNTSLFVDGAVINSFPVDIFLDECSKFSYKKVVGVDLPQLEPKKFFGLKVTNIDEAYNPVFNSSIPTPATRNNINFFSLINVMLNNATLGQNSKLTKEWIDQTADLINPVRQSVLEPVTVENIIFSYNNGIVTASDMMKIFIESKGQKLRN